MLRNRIGTGNAPTRLAQTGRRLLGAALAAIALARIFGVSMIPVITNDSVGYLSHSQNLGGEGLMRAGFRQIGYPIYLAVADTLGSITSTEPILLAAVLQRGLLIIALAYAVWLFRWWAAPIVILMTSPDMVAYTNFLLVEGIAIPLSLLLGIMLCHLVLIVAGKAPSLKLSRTRTADETSLTRVIAVIAALLVVVLTLLKYQSIVFVLPLLAVLGFTYRRTDLRRFSLAVGVSVLAVLAAISLAQSLENQNEYDDFFPLTRGVRNAYWGTWQIVFAHHRENRTDPNLAEYFDGGTPWPFIREVEEVYETYPEQREAFEEAIDDMLETAGINKRRAQLVSAWEATRGGRIDDVGGLVAKMRAANAGDVYEVIHVNAAAVNEGIAVYVAGYNDGQRVEPVLTAPLFPSFSSVLARRTLNWLGPVMLALLVVGATLRSTGRPLFIAAFVSVATVSLFLGSLLADNYRYVITSLVFAVPVSLLAAKTASLQAESALQRRTRLGRDDGASGPAGNDASLS